MSGRQWVLVLSVLVILAALSTLWSGGLLAASALQQLTTDPGADVRPVWSPDGQRVAFQSNRSGSYSIWIMDADGRNQREVIPGTSDDRHPDWSPDGKQLAFDSDASGSREIWIVDSDGQNPQRITALGALSSFPAWSPDGAQLVFYVYQEGIMDLWVVKVDGRDSRPLTSELADERRSQCTFACHQAAWSPDGQQIVYTGGDHQSIWVIDVDGSDATELVPSTEHNHFPWYTTDGRIGYLVEHVGSNESWSDAWLLDPVSGEVTLLLDHIQLQGPFEWSPDETKLLFHSPRSGNFDIYVADLLAEGGREALQTRPGAVTSSPGLAEETSPDAAAPGAPAGTDVEAPAPEATSRAWFASPLVLGALVLAGLIGLVGLIVVTGVRRKPRV